MTEQMRKLKHIKQTSLLRRLWFLSDSQYSRFTGEQKTEKAFQVPSKSVLMLRSSTWKAGTDWFNAAPTQLEVAWLYNSCEHTLVDQNDTLSFATSHYF